MNEIAAIPTRYAGVQFRSRLEARWAALFDLISWRWEYEPIDLNGYIPDFIVESDYLVEVKPIVKWPCPVVSCTTCSDTPRVEYDDALNKIHSSGWAGRHAVIVGASIFDARIDAGEMYFPCLGRVVLSDFWMPYAGFDFMRSDLVADWREAGNRVQWRRPI